MSKNTIESNLIQLRDLMSKMMRESSERDVVMQLDTYRIAIKECLKVMTKKQLNTDTLTSSEFEDKLNRGL